VCVTPTSCVFVKGGLSAAPFNGPIGSSTAAVQEDNLDLRLYK